MKPRYKTARCILFREDRYLLAVHHRFRYRSQPRWGLPGGQIEWREAPHVAAARELEEELQICVSDLMEVGAYPYKRALHMVYAAPLTEDIRDFDESELAEIGWFTEAEVVGLKAGSALHADYELDAIRRLRAQLSGDLPAAAAAG